MTESLLQSQILRALGSHPDIRAFRNLVGSGFVGVPPDRLRRVTFGLAPGSADLVGFRCYEIRPRDVGKRIAVFTSVEIKRPRKSHTAQNQRDWQAAVIDRGGIAIIATNPTQALHGVLDWILP